MYSWSDYDTSVSDSKWKHNVAMSSLRKHRSHVGHQHDQEELGAPFELPKPVTVTLQVNTGAASKWSLGSLVRSGWGTLKRHLGTGNLLVPGAQSLTLCDDDDDEDNNADPQSPVGHARMVKANGAVDLVVVDRDWSSFSDPQDATTVGGLGVNIRPNIAQSISSSGTSISQSSFTHAPIDPTHPNPHPDSPLPKSKFRLKSFFHTTLWPLCLDFFSSTYQDKATEAVYAREQWAMEKPLASWSCVFMIVNWVLGTVFIPMPIILPDTIFYYAVSPSYCAC